MLIISVFYGFLLIWISEREYNGFLNLENELPKILILTDSEIVKNCKFFNLPGPVKCYKKFLSRYS